MEDDILTQPLDDQASDGDLQQPDETAVDGQLQPQDTQPVTFTQDQVNEMVTKRIARERRTLEKAGINLVDFENMAKRYNVTLPYLVRHTLNSYEEGLGQQGYQQQQQQQQYQQQPGQYQYDPRVDALLMEREEGQVKKLWKTDFGAEPTQDDIESLKDLQEQYAINGKVISLDDAYSLATRGILKDKFAKWVESKVMNDLKMKHKGKVMGPAQTAAQIPKFNSLKDALNAAAEEVFKK
jgi:hypothetical protein